MKRACDGQSSGASPGRVRREASAEGATAVVVLGATKSGKSDELCRRGKTRAELSLLGSAEVSPQCDGRDV